MSSFLRLAFLISFFVQIFVVNSKETFADKLQSIDEKLDKHLEILKNESQAQAQEMNKQFKILIDQMQQQQLTFEKRLKDQEDRMIGQKLNPILTKLTTLETEKQQKIENLSSQLEQAQNFNKNSTEKIQECEQIAEHQSFKIEEFYILKDQLQQQQLQFEKFLKEQVEQTNRKLAEELANVQKNLFELTQQGKEKQQEIESLHEKLKAEQLISKNLNEKLEQELLRSSNISEQLQICNQNSTQQTEIIQELKIEKLKLEELLFLPPCENFLHQANTEQGIFKINLNESELKPFDVNCQRTDEEAWLIIQRRQDGSVNFYRNWTDYKNGFGDLDGEFWLGLEKLHQLTKNHEWELKIWLRNNDGEEGFARYKIFKVGNETEQYKLTVGEFSGNVSDQMKVNNGMKFVTADRDSIGWSGDSCTNLLKGAWWFAECGANILNGDFFGNDEFHYGIYWYTFGLKLTYSQMAIRRLK